MSLTSQPPQPPATDPQESAETEPPTKAAFLRPTNRRIRVGASSTAQRAQIYNANYMSDGTKYASFDRPWTAFTAIDFRTFTTHHEALQWATQEAEQHS